MKDWIRKPWNIFFVVSVVVGAAASAYGFTHLWKYLAKGINVLQLKSSVTELVVYAVLSLAGLFWIFAAWRIRWDAMVMDNIRKNAERLQRLEEKAGL